VESIEGASVLLKKNLHLFLLDLN